MKRRQYFEALADAGKALKIEKELISALQLRAQVGGCGRAATVKLTTPLTVLV
jgi:hypothetical protein